MTQFLRRERGAYRLAGSLILSLSSMCAGPALLACSGDSAGYVNPSTPPPPKDAATDGHKEGGDAAGDGAVLGDGSTPTDASDGAAPGDGATSTGHDAATDS